MGQKVEILRGDGLSQGQMVETHLCLNHAITQILKPLDPAAAGTDILVFVMYSNIYLRVIRMTRKM